MSKRVFGARTLSKFAVLLSVLVISLTLCPFPITRHHPNIANSQDNLQREHSRLFANLCFVPEGQMEIAHRFIGGTIG
ncbi:MAG: hypothetical protein NUV74_17950 [Candidatus Brocadiaceae bacterium]|nr:hypothetical protein [Candidatus Brocadiaceae bacterium]